MSYPDVRGRITSVPPGCCSIENLQTSMEFAVRHGFYKSSILVDSVATISQRLRRRMCIELPSQRPLYALRCHSLPSMRSSQVRFPVYLAVMNCAFYDQDVAWELPIAFLDTRHMMRQCRAVLLP